MINGAAAFTRCLGNGNQTHSIQRQNAAVSRNKTRNDETDSLMLNEAQSPYKFEVWRRLTPRERLRRSWQMRSRIPDLKAVHDRKLFPKI
jgi:hypothetical protein